MLRYSKLASCAVLRRAAQSLLVPSSRAASAVLSTRIIDYTSIAWFSSSSSANKDDRGDVIIPGTRGGSHEYGSLGDSMPGSIPKSSILSSSSSSQNKKKPWQAAENSRIQNVTQKALIYELTQAQTQTIESVVPWFLNNMPASYFRQIPEPFRMDHIKAIAAVKDANMDLYLNLKSQLPDGRQILTYIRDGTKPGTLLKMMQDLPWKYDTGDANDYLPLSRLHVFSTEDESMSLNIFVFGVRDPSLDRKSRTELAQIAAPILDYAQMVLDQGGDIIPPSPTSTATEPENDPEYYDHHQPVKPSSFLERENLLSYIDQCSQNYISFGVIQPRRFLQHLEMFQQVQGTEGTAVHIEAEQESSSSSSLPGTTGSMSSSLGTNHHHAYHKGQQHYWVDVAVANSLPRVALEHLCRLLYLHQFDVVRARLDVLPGENDDSKVTIIRTLVAPVDKEKHVSHETFDVLAQELKRAKWLDPTTMDLVFDKYPWLGVTRGEVITAFCALMHPVLAKDNSIAFSKANIIHTITSERFIHHAADIAQLFLDRFNPKSPLSNHDLSSRSEVLQKAIKTDVEDAVAMETLLMMIDIIKHTYKTNVYMENRYALGLRLDPKIMESRATALCNKTAAATAASANKRELPYGVFFVHGRRFNGFHVRFRDIARGGLRLVTPRSPEQYALESQRQYDECYGLAFAQQLKNKDIPEGGSKAVNLIDVNNLTEASKRFVMRKSVKAFTDSILDLIVDTEETRDKIVDLYGKPEVLYLGPDEQVIPEDINWIVQRAAIRGYTTPPAFMSSKPRAGINHKEYGVTSEGVNVYLDVALRRVLGIDPNKESFTIKLTGGPDGDVAGNEIKILRREYGNNAKIVGISDISGCAEDPQGLDFDELIRLVKEGLSISEFNKSKLSSKGVLHTCDTPEGTKARNTMHNRVKADAFVPCGGRPNTIDGTNWQQFLNKNGEPSSRLIVEGANLFITAEARQALFEHAGVVIVKDSSANKGGVICSSYEICAAMLATEEEFFANKEKIVSEVVANLRGLAKLEATLLLREFELFGGSLPEVSQVISNCINITTDALAVALDTLSEEDRESLMPLFRAHLPKTLADMSFDSVHSKVPQAYIKNAISSCLASKLVYKEGTKFISCLPQDRLASIALEYVAKEKEIATMIESLELCSLDDEEKQKIKQLLEAGGARTALGIL